MTVAIAIISPVVVFVIVLLVLHRINKRTHIFQNPRSLPWLYVVLIVLYSPAAWLYFFTRSSLWLVVPFVAMSTLFAGTLLVSVTNWRGWGKRLLKSSPYTFLHDPEFRVIAMIVASLGLASDLLLLTLLLVR